MMANLFSLFASLGSPPDQPDRSERVEVVRRDEVVILNTRNVQLAHAFSFSLPAVGGKRTTALFSMPVAFDAKTVDPYWGDMIDPHSLTCLFDGKEYGLSFRPVKVGQIPPQRTGHLRNHQLRGYLETELIWEQAGDHDLKLAYAVRDAYDQAPVEESYFVDVFCPTRSVEVVIYGRGVALQSVGTPDDPDVYAIRLNGPWHEDTPDEGTPVSVEAKRAVDGQNGRLTWDRGNIHWTLSQPKDFQRYKLRFKSTQTTLIPSAAADPGGALSPEVVNQFRMLDCLLAADGRSELTPRGEFLLVATGNAELVATGRAAFDVLDHDPDVYKLRERAAETLTARGLSAAGAIEYFVAPDDADAD